MIQSKWTYGRIIAPNKQCKIDELSFEKWNSSFRQRFQLLEMSVSKRFIFYHFFGLTMGKRWLAILTGCYPERWENDGNVLIE